MICLLQATRLPTFFPSLKVLKIQTDNHSLIDMLEKLDEKFCKQIEELSIATEQVQNGADQEMEHEKDITDILAKFKGLKSLKVTSSAMNYDEKHLLTVCPHLKESRAKRNLKWSGNPAKRRKVQIAVEDDKRAHRLRERQEEQLELLQQQRQRQMDDDFVLTYVKAKRLHEYRSQLDFEPDFNYIVFNQFEKDEWLSILKKFTPNFT